ncbi:MAG TPA: aminotransferase class V-fold PLP-dependent enzyme [Aliidongia sp.]|uniref:aminotransferase class V-fold PLP-dependent enzyme n=1 Tax=Aliidongia sp. TaxID=1914230 RepID=UPI002DDD6E0C|nr:aminotransferase class V-fold PLP-dependent enzyme [Aliidongia sp.]HEV2675023.1 aminotransferase class V-fold PLP-dependent enzyme [Aliidongia sp.]
MTIDVARLRAGTPGTDRVLHLNHAGSSLMAAATLQAIEAQLRREAEGGSMEAGGAVAAQVEQARADIATLLGADPDEIAFTGGVSDGWGRAFAALRLRPGDKVLVGRTEWGGNLACLERAGLVVEAVPADEHGQISLEALARKLDGQVRLVALTWAPANGGLIQPAAAVGRLVRAAGVPYFIDAAQVVGQMPVDVREVGCDVLAAPARKHLRGPRGVGLLYVRRDFADRLDPAFVDTHSAPIGPDGAVLRAGARRLESAESAPALRLGLGVAVRQALDLGLDRIRATIVQRADGLRARLAAVPGVRLQDLGVERSGLVAFTLDGRSGAEVQATLATQGINLGFNGRAYTPLDMDARGLTEVLRASVSYLTTEAELDRFVAALTALGA